MPYTNIVFVKLFLDLVDEDDRFLFKLSDQQQLLYVKLLYLAGRTHNKIPKNFDFIKQKINYRFDAIQFNSDIEAIKSVFHKFIERADCYRFKKFEELHNRINDAKIGSSQGVPKEVQRGIPKEKEIKRKEKESKEARLFYLSPENLKTLKAIYKTDQAIKDHLIKTRGYAEDEVTRAFDKLALEVPV